MFGPGEEVAGVVPDAHRDHGLQGQPVGPEPDRGVGGKPERPRVGVVEVDRVGRGEQKPAALDRIRHHDAAGLRRPELDPEVAVVGAGAARAGRIGDA